MYYSIHACRAAAAMMVVLFHLGGTFAQDKYFAFKSLDGPFAWGDAGVDFFFVLSGFIITITHLADVGRPERLGTYIRKRFSRVYPAYWIVFASLCVASIFVPSFRQSMPTDLGIWVRSLALVPQDPAVIGGTGAPVLFVAWSLQYEFVFYMLFAAFILNRWIGFAAFGLLAVNYFFCFPATSCSFPSSFLASNFVILFMLGVATACLRRVRFSLKRPLIVAIAGGIAFVLFGLAEVYWHAKQIDIDRRLIYGVLSALIIAGLSHAEDQHVIAPRTKVIALAGDSSYALYLLHIPVISVMTKLMLGAGVSGTFPVIVAFVMIFIVCVVAAMAFHTFIERPLLKFLRPRQPVFPDLGHRPVAG